MKRKLYSIITAVFILFACVFASACGDKYKDLQFEVTYAFSQDATEWYDASNGIILAYGDDTPLVFGPNGATIYVKVKIKNVDEKHIGSITASSVTTNLGFVSTTIGQNGVFALPITGVVTGDLSIFDNNSGKSTSIPLRIGAELEALNADLSVRPAILDNSIIDFSQYFNGKKLVGFKGWDYQETLETGLRYEIVAAGNFFGGVYNVVTDMLAYDYADNVASVSGSTLKVEDAGFSKTQCGWEWGETNSVLKIRAVSTAHDDEVGGDYIYTEFYVYVVTRAGASFKPVLSYNEAGDISVEKPDDEYELTLYQNNEAGEKFGAIDVYTAMSDSDDLNFDILNLNDGEVAYGINVYIDDEICEFVGQPISKNGITVVEEEKGAHYKIILDDATSDPNRVEFKYELQGANLVFAGQKPSYSSVLNIKKDLLPSKIVLNGDDSMIGKTFDIYTNSGNNDGVKFDLGLNVDSDLIQDVIVTFGDALVVKSAGRTIASGDPVAVNKSLNVAFNLLNDKETGEITFKVKRAPSTFAGASTSETDLEVTYTFNRVVTADRIEFYSDKAMTQNITGASAVVAKGKETRIYAKVYASNDNFDSSTVKFLSKDEILSNATISNVYKAGYYEAYFDVTTAEDSSVYVEVAEGQVGVEAEVAVKVVDVIDGSVGADTFKITTDSEEYAQLVSSVVESGKSFETIFNYAVVRANNFTTFSIANASAIASLDIDVAPGFDKTIVNLDKLSNSQFTVRGRIVNENVQYKLSINYYTYNKSSGEGVVSSSNEEIRTLEFVVIEPIATIESRLTDVQTGQAKDSISYTNSQFPNANMVNVNLTILSNYASDPTSKVDFLSDAIGEITNVSGLKISIDSTLYDYVRFEGLTLTSDGGRHYAVLPTNTKTITMILQQNYHGSLEFVLTALRFGKESSVERVVSVEVAQVEKAIGVELSGKSLVSYTNDNAELQLSFMAETGTNVNKTFVAKAKYSTITAKPGFVRFGDLGYKIEKYDVDENGNIKLDKNGEAVIIPDATNFNLFVDINNATGEVNVYSIKGQGGGIYKLTIYTKDSYNESTRKFDNGQPMTVRVSDGTERYKYVISNANDLTYVKNDPTAHYVLAANIDATSIPMPLTLDAFTGSFSGSFATLDAEDKTVTERFVLSYTLKQVADAKTDSYGDAYGLFAIIGNDTASGVKGIVRDIDLIVSLGDIRSENSGGLKIGGVAGVNLGEINNVNLAFRTSDVTFVNTTCSNTLFGGMVGFNNGSIQMGDSSVDGSNGLKLHFKNEYGTTGTCSYNAGMIAGENYDNGQIAGDYNDKTSLEKSIVLDVYANLHVTGEADYVTFDGAVGGIVAVNRNNISNLIISGKIYSNTSSVAGVAEYNISGDIDTVSTIALDLTAVGAAAGGINLSGLNDTISNVRVMATDYTYNSIKTQGIIKADSVYGISGDMSAVVTYASVEDFRVNPTEAMLQAGSTGFAYGLGEGTYTNSFVRADIDSTQFYFTSDDDKTNSNTYFIGKATGTKAGDIQYPDYYVEYTDTSITYNGTELLNSTYINDADNSIKTAVYEALFAGISSDFAHDATWGLASDLNTVSMTYNGKPVIFYFPYLKDANGDPLMIVRPTDFEITINNSYMENINSTPIEPDEDIDFPIQDSYTITETAIVNYFYNKSMSETDLNRINTHAVTDLVELKVIPSSAQGGLKFEIVGDGFLYASINTNDEIVFTRPSGNTPIIVKCYSLFNPSLVEYVAFYTQYGVSELELISSNISYVNEYQMTLFTGTGNSAIDVKGVNEYLSKSFMSILDAEALMSDNLVIVGERDNGTSSKLVLNPNTANGLYGFTIGISSAPGITINQGGESEYVTFTLYIKNEYFGGTAGEDDIKLAQVKLRVDMFNSANDIKVTTSSDVEINTSNEMKIGVNLLTNYVDVYHSVDHTGSMYTEDAVVAGELVSFKDSFYNKDGINFEFIYENQAELTKLLARAEVDSVAELFEYVAKYKPLFTGSSLTMIGYSYNIEVFLKDEYKFRYIEAPINLQLKISAQSNANVVINPYLDITINPATISTKKIDAYPVTASNPISMTGSSLVASTVASAVIEPGGLGTVLYIHAQPNYAHITKASISSTELFVPSLGKNVNLTFIQTYYDEKLNRFVTLQNNYQEDLTLELDLITRKDMNGEEHFDGVLYVYAQLTSAFAGLEDGSISASVTLTSGGVEHKVVQPLVTTYIPGVSLSYGEYKVGHDTYLIEKGTRDNLVTVKLYGYEFNQNPDLKLNWIDGYADGALIGNYVKLYLNNDVKDNADKSYSMTGKLVVASDIPAGFTLSGDIQVMDKNGIITHATTNILTFCPTDFLLKEVSLYNMNENSMYLAVDESGILNFRFDTNNSLINGSDALYEKLLADIKQSVEESLAQEYRVKNPSATLTEIQDYLTSQADLISTRVDEKLLGMFTYNNGRNSLADKSDKFEASVIVDKNSVKRIQIVGLDQCAITVTLEVYFEYVSEANGLQAIKFMPYGSSKSYNFRIVVYTTGSEEEAVPIHSADEMFDENGNFKLAEYGHYILMNDIDLSSRAIKPINKVLGSLDGNNKVIKLGQFIVDGTQEQSEHNYGLFAQIGEYSYENEDGAVISGQTILKNVIVDYSAVDAISFLGEKITNINFGGLVARNNGGLIYNCDVMNLGTKTKNISLLVNDSETTSITFGGLVAINDGIITNSRVGRASYDKITANAKAETVKTVNARPINFVIAENANKYKMIMGGFVGQNTQEGIIASSYVANTGLSSASTNVDTNIMAGFVGENQGDISYSFIKSLETTENTSAYSKGAVIKNSGNGIVAGFVYNNYGTIINSYANTELYTKSAYISGFVYSNMSGALISESYSACTMKSEANITNAVQPFVGITSKNVLLSDGTLENCYYLMEDDNSNMALAGDGEKDQATGLILANFKQDNLNGFVFVLSSNAIERNQSIWSMRTLDGDKCLLPELMSVNKISHSYRYLVDVEAEDGTKTSVLRYAMSYNLGSENNPQIVRSAKEYNKVFTADEHKNSFVGHVRFVNKIDFSKENLSIKTKFNFTLGDKVNAYNVTSVEGNGMTVSGIFLGVEGDITADTGNYIGMFSNIANAYVKNINLEFATPSSGQTSTFNVSYVGGLAGKIHNGVIMNVALSASGTTLAGENFVGGLAGMITGTSLVYGVDSNLGVTANKTNSVEYLYYNENDYLALNKIDYENYLPNLSYAGGLAGVIDIKEKTGVDYNLSYINIYGDKMTAGKKGATIYADYAGGIAGYASDDVTAFRNKYHVGTQDAIYGTYVAGGLYGIMLGDIVASQVTSIEDKQYLYDTEIGKIVTNVATSGNVEVGDIGNEKLINSSKTAGGLVGVMVDGSVYASYSKASFVGGTTVGGLIGASLSSKVSYSYAVPYINFETSNEEKFVGGLYGYAYKVEKDRNLVENNAMSQYEDLTRLYLTVARKTNETSFTFSTLIFKDDYELKANAVYDNISATPSGNASITSNGDVHLTGVYAGAYRTDVETAYVTDTVIELYQLYSKTSQAETVFQTVFDSWNVVPYWTLNSEKYYPLLLNEDVENYIEIKNQGDFHKLVANPGANFKIVQDIDMSNWNKNNNWVFDTVFTGKMIGEDQDKDGTRPRVFNLELHPTNADTTGLFRETYNANIQNIVFEWKEIKDMSGGKLTTVGGVSCQDSGSTFSALDVIVKSQTGNATKEFLVGGNVVISGFGGIVGNAKDTNISSCKFAGNVTATFRDGDSYFGGLVGKAERTERSESGAMEEEEEEIKYMAISNSQVGLIKDLGNNPTTIFNITTAGENVYFGGLVGHITSGSIATSSLGCLTEDEITGHKYIKINFTLGNTKNIYAGGIVGYSDKSNVDNCTILSKVNVGGTSSDTITDFKLGGIAGGMNAIEDNAESSFEVKNVNVDIDITANPVTSQPEIDNSLTADVTIAGLQISGGIANAGSGLRMTTVFVTGAIEFESEALVQTVYAGGLMGYAGNVTIDNSISMLDLTVGSKRTTGMYAGGLVGLIYTQNNDDEINLNYLNTTGKVVPVMGADDTSTGTAYVGGIVGRINKGTKQGIFNADYIYSTTSIIADGIKGTGVKNSKINALFGEIRVDTINIGNTTKDKVAVATVADEEVFDTIFYSSDLALVAQEKIDDKHYGTNMSVGDLWIESIFKKEYFERRKDGEYFVPVKVSKSGADKFGVPMVASLANTLVTYGVLLKDNSNVYSFADATVGESYNPKMLNASADAVADFTYYLVNVTDKKDPDVLTNVTINGVLVGMDAQATGATEETDNCFIEKVECHSAVSNIHVQLVAGSTYTGGIIVKENNGVIFNCSVKGISDTTGNNYITVNNAGMIAYTNKGLVSHCYMVAEINAGNNVGGIVYSNEGGNIVSCYNTGYFNSAGSNITGGIIGTYSRGYIYNNYMAGVIKNIAENSNSFCGTGSDIMVGENNFVDELANVEKLDFTAVKSVNSLGLMNANVTGIVGWNLVGNWHTSTSDFNRSAVNFKYNYNYPIYDFNKKLMESETASSLIDIIYYLQETGGDEQNNAKNSANYDNLAGNDPSAYTKALKVPHLGVMSLVLNKYASDNINIAIIYDIDGRGSDLWAGALVSASAAYTGAAVSNKLLGFSSYAESGTQGMCRIDNLSTTGLFGNKVGNSTIGKVIFGNMTNMTNSGAIGGTVESSAKEPTEEFTVTLKEIYFKPQPGAKDPYIQIAGKTDDDNSFGALFGVVAGGSVVNINEFNTGDDLRLIGNKAYNKTDYVGLVAGENVGSIKLDAESKMTVAFQGCGNVGGIAGTTSGTITGTTGTIINIDMTKNSRDTDLNGAVGGATAISNGATIQDITINFLVDGVTNKESAARLHAGHFGGVIQKVSGISNIKSVTLTASLLTGGGSDLNLWIQQHGTESYLGLLAGELAGSLTVNTFTIDEKIKQVGFISKEKNYDETTTARAVGLLLGKQNGDLMIKESTIQGIKLISDGVENLGTVAGWFESGTVDIQSAIGGAEADAITLEGTTNVGGIFGQADHIYHDIANNPVDTSEPEVIDDPADPAEPTYGPVFINGSTIGLGSTQFAVINILNDADDEKILSNFGGLFGLLKSFVEGDGAMPVSSGVEITNNNPIELGEAVISDSKHAYVYNIGGIAGKFAGQFDIDASTTNNVVTANLTNNATITSKMDQNEASGIVEDDTKDFLVSSYKDSSNEGKYTVTTKGINVGGIFGTIELQAESTGDAEIPDAIAEPGADEVTEIVIAGMSNAGNVQGYENVGGLVGKFVGIDELNLLALKGDVTWNGTQPEASEYGSDGNSVDTTSMLSGSSSSTGDVTGVMNVGGVVGYLGANANILNMMSSASVYGNANVGGMAGLMVPGSTIDMSAVSGGADTEIKGVFYINNTKDGDKLASKVFIPTSIGGLVGRANSTDTASETPVPANIDRAGVSSVKVTTASESFYLGKGSNYSSEDASFVISTNSNYTIDNTESNFKIEGIRSTEKTKFEEMKTGIGGFIGTTDRFTISKDEKRFNYVGLSEVTVYAELGVNVSAFYGTVMDGLAAGADADSGIQTPYLSGDTKVAGMYNIGGIVGYWSDITDAGKTIEYAPSINGSGTIQLQPFDADEGFEIVGSMYVGAVAGRIDANHITIESTVGLGDIQIHTDNSYYNGGLVGKWVATGEENTFKAVLTADVIAGEQDDKEDFGAFIGVLKVDNFKESDTGDDAMGGIIVNVLGIGDDSHKYPFTVNTIQNQNYADGAASIKQEVHNLYADAYYVNLDTLNIVGSERTYTHNPLLDATADGWAVDYTGFRQLMRCIPQEGTYKGEPLWDSLAVVYDASNITKVCYNEDERKINYTIYVKDQVNTYLYSKYGIAVNTGTDKSQYYDKDDEGNYTDLKDDYHMFDVVNDVSGGKLNFNNIITDSGADDPYEMKDLVWGIGDYLDSTDTNYFLFSAIYRNESLGSYTDGSKAITDQTANSGSVFEVHSYVESFNWNQTESEKHRNWWAIIVTAVVAIGFAALCVFVPGGAAVVLGAIKAWAVKHAILSMIGFGALYLTVNMATQTYYTQTSTAGQFTLSTLDRNLGLLGSTNMIRLRYDENNKLDPSIGSVITVTDGDKSKGENNETALEYFYCSMEKPADYYSRFYTILTVDPTLSAEQDRGTKDFATASGKSFNTQGLTYSISKAVDDLNTAGVDEGNYFNYIKNVDSHPLIEHNKYSKDDPTTHKKSASAYQTYIYMNGAYYYYAMASDVEYYPTQLPVDELGDNLTAKSSGLTYAYGQASFDATAGKYVYSYSQNNGSNSYHANNKLTESDGKYYTQIGELTDAVSIEKPVKFEWKDSKPTDAILGYTYVDTVYLTANGSDTKVEGYAKFARAGKESEVTIDSNWVYGIDYIRAGSYETGEYNKKFEAITTFRESDDGYYYNENYSPIAKQEAIVKCAAGETVYIKVDDTDSPIYASYIYKFVGAGENNNAKTMHEWAGDASAGDYINVIVYAHSFENPYHTGTALQSNGTSEGWGCYIPSSSGELSLNVTYYYYDSGYIYHDVDGDYEKDILVPVDTRNPLQLYDTSGNPVQFTYVDTNTEDTVLGDWTSDGTTLLFSNLANYYASYDAEDTANNKKADLVFMFDPASTKRLYVKNNEYNDGYFEGEGSNKTQDGKIYATYITTDIKSNFFSNRYLTNPTYDIFTLYKYTSTSNRPLDLINLAGSTHGSGNWTIEAILNNGWYLIESVSVTLGGSGSDTSITKFGVQVNGTDKTRTAGQICVTKPSGS